MVVLEFQKSLYKLCSEDREVVESFFMKEVIYIELTNSPLLSKYTNTSYFSTEA